MKTHFLNSSPFVYYLVSFRSNIFQFCNISPELYLTLANILPGEMLIGEAQNVLMFAQVCERKQGRSGLLCVTNFKLSFITADDKSKEVRKLLN